MFVLKLPYATMSVLKLHSIGLTIAKYVIMNDCTDANRTRASAHFYCTEHSANLIEYCYCYCNPRFSAPCPPKPGISTSTLTPHIQCRHAVLDLVLQHHHHNTKS